MTTYCVEPFSAARPEMEQLLEAHWRELGRDQDDPRFALKPDWDTYAALEALGQILMVVVRIDGVMGGYYIGFVRRQLHYVGSLALTTDVFFLQKEYRQGRIGLELFKEVEKAAVARGVDKIYLGCKSAEELDRSRLFEHLGYTRIEYTFAKVISNGMEPRL